MFDKITPVLPVLSSYFTLHDISSLVLSSKTARLFIYVHTNEIVWKTILRRDVLQLQVPFLHDLCVALNFPILPILQAVHNCPFDEQFSSFQRKFFQFIMQLDLTHTPTSSEMGSFFTMINQQHQQAILTVYVNAFEDSWRSSRVKESSFEADLAFLSWECKLPISSVYFWLERALQMNSERQIAAIRAYCGPSFASLFTTEERQNACFHVLQHRLEPEVKMEIYVHLASTYACQEKFDEELKMFHALMEVAENVKLKSLSFLKFFSKIVREHYDPCLWRREQFDTAIDLHHKMQEICSGAESLRRAHEQDLIRLYFYAKNDIRTAKKKCEDMCPITDVKEEIPFFIHWRCCAIQNDWVQLRRSLKMAIDLFPIAHEAWDLCHFGSSLLRVLQGWSTVLDVQDGNFKMALAHEDLMYQSDRKLMGGHEIQQRYKARALCKLGRCTEAQELLQHLEKTTKDDLPGFCSVLLEKALLYLNPEFEAYDRDHAEEFLFQASRMQLPRIYLESFGEEKVKDDVTDTRRFDFVNTAWHIRQLLHNTKKRKHNMIGYQNAESDIDSLNELA
jgi:hypothetical protein